MKRLLILGILALFAMSPFFVLASPLTSFEENPIPYWEDNSSDVALSWDSTEQTVTVEAEPLYWEDFSDVSDWNALNDPIMTDGDIATITTSGDYVWDRWDCNTPDGSSDWEGFNLKMRWKSNITEALKFAISIRTADNYEGNVLYAQFYVTPAVAGVWSVWDDTVSHDNVGNYECVSLLLRSYQNIQVDIDYILVGEPNLDVAVPVTPQSIQSLELMGNFSALNSTVRFQMYDNDTASDLFCDVNSTQVTFPDTTYAEFTVFVRINFSLNEEKSIFRIYVSAQNTTLINYYSIYSGLANKDYLRMNDSAFIGSFTLWYLQGDVGYLEDLSMQDNIFYQLFLSTELYGYFGPLALVVIGFFITKKEKNLGIFMIIVDSLVIATYLSLIEATPNYWWHVIILILGVVQCTIQLIDR